MKKLLPIILCLAIIATCFVACSSSKKDDTKKEEDTSVSATVITTDDAKITEADAINLIESYSNKELGITKEDREASSFMVASSGEYIEEKDAYYVKVIAAVKEAHENPDTKEITYTFDYKGEYYIRYDGKQILTKNMETNEYSELKVKDVPTTTQPTTHSKEEIEAAQKDKE